MRARINILSDKHSISDTEYNSLRFDETTVTIKQNGNILFSDLLTAVEYNSVGFKLNDSNAIRLDCSVSKERYVGATKIGTLLLNIPLIRITDSVTFEITVTHNDYFTYSNNITLFGYDVGNNINFGTTDGKFTGITNGDAIAAANNLYNPIVEVSTGSLTPVYGQEDGTTIFRHNPDFNIGMIPLLIDDGMGGTMAQDLSLGTSGRVLLLKNPLTEAVLIRNTNSNQPSVPVHTITYKYKTVVGSTYSDITSSDFVITMATEDYEIGKYFNLGTDPAVIQKHYLIKYINVRHTVTKMVNGQQLSLFTGVLNGSINTYLNIDETSVFKFWSVDNSNLSAIAGILLYTKLELNVNGVYQFLDSAQNVISFQDTDILQYNTGYIPYLYSNHINTLNTTVVGIVKLTISVMYLGIEDSTYKKVTGNTIADGTNYMIGSNGTLNNENYAAIGASNTLSGHVFTAINTFAYSFINDGSLYEVVDDPNVPYGIYGQITTNLGTVYSHLTAIYTDIVSYSASITGYIRLLPIYESIESIEVPYNEFYSITSTSCGIVTINIFGYQMMSDIDVIVYKYNPQTNVFDYFDENVLPVNTNTYNYSYTDGIYKITITIDGNTNTYIFFSTCSIEQCYINIIKGAVCECCDNDDCRAKAYYRLNEFMILWNTYLSMISVNLANFDMISNNLIDYNSLLNIVEISKMQNRLIDLCNDCNSMTKKCKTC